VIEPERPLLRAVEVMDRLRSPGGCPWDAAQTHESLTRYLLEEAYEVIEAIETGDRALLREELGDLLLQVLFHCRIEQESALEPFGIDEVAAELVAKLVRRHPHVFGNASAGSAAELNETWERQKVEEKGRTSAVDGVPVHQPALALTAKLISRARRSGVDVGLPAAEPGDFGTRLFAVAAEAVAAGVDPEAALRRAARSYRDAVQTAEQEGSAETESGR
jgi:XTP/dITP diphosphohydrolase